MAQLAEAPDFVQRWHRSNALIGAGPAGYVYQVRAAAPAAPAPARAGGGSLRRAARVAGAQRPNGGAAGGEAGGRRRRGDGGCAGRGAAAVPGNQTPQPRQVLLSTHVSLPP